MSPLHIGLTMGHLTTLSIELSPQYLNDECAQAALRILDACNRHQGGGTVPLNRFLLSLYNGEEWAPDMQLLCGRIDPPLFEDVVCVMRGYHERGIELHRYFVGGDKLFAEIACRVPKRSIV